MSDLSCDTRGLRPVPNADATRPNVIADTTARAAAPRSGMTKSGLLGFHEVDRFLGPIGSRAAILVDHMNPNLPPGPDGPKNHEDIPSGSRNRTSPKDGTSRPGPVTSFETWPGAVAWHLDHDSPGPTPSLSATACIAIGIPSDDRKDGRQAVDELRLFVSIARKGDPKTKEPLIVAVEIGRSPDAFVDTIVHVGPPGMRGNSEPYATLLPGRVRQVAPGAFVAFVGSAGSQKADRKTAATFAWLERADWLDLPILFQNGRRGKLTIEKGPIGSSAIRAVLETPAQPVDVDFSTRAAARRARCLDTQEALDP